MPVVGRAPVREREEIQQHLQVPTLYHVAEGKLLAAGLVVHHAQVELPLVQPPVDPVGDADEGEPLPAFPEGDGRDVLCLGEIQFKVQRRKVRHPQFLRHVEHDAAGVVPQTLEEIDEAAALLLKVIEFFRDVEVDEPVGEGGELLVRDGAKAAPLPDCARDVFQHIVDEGAVFRRLEARRLVGLCLEPVLAEIGKAAGGKLLDARGAQPEALPVKALHAGAGEAAAGERGRRLERGALFRGGLGEVDGRSLLAPAAAADRLGCETERGRRGGHARIRQIPVFHRQREQALCAVEDEGGAQLCPVPVRQRAEHCETLRGEGHGVIDQGELPPEFAVPAGAEIDVQLLETAALVEGEDPAALLRHGQAAVGGTEDDQMPDVPAAVSVKVPGGHAVKRDGDRADVIAREHQREEPAEVRGVHGRVAEDAVALLEGADHQIPELAVLGGALVAAESLQLICPAAERLGQAQGGKEGAERFGLLRRGHGLVGGPLKGAERPRHAAPEGIDARKALFDLFGVLPVVAVGVLVPVPRALPGAAAQLPLEDVVFQLVAFVLVQTRKPGAQVAHHVVESPAALNDLIGAGDEGGQGLCHQIGARRREQRHPVVAEHALDRAAVIFPAARDQRDIAPAAAAVPHEGEAEGGGLLALGGHALRAYQADRRTPFKVRVGIVEHVLGEEAEGPGVPGLGRERRDAHLPPQLLRRGGEDMCRPAGEGEDLALAVKIVQREADCHLQILPQHGAEHLLLLPREVDEAVHIDLRAGREAARVDLGGEQREPVGGVGAAVCDHALVGVQHQRQIPQLVAQPVGTGVRRGVQHVGVDAGGLEFVHRGEQQVLHLRPALGVPVDREPRAHTLEGQRHAQHAPALIQPGGGGAAELCGRAAGETRKAQHLRVERQPVAADAAELALGLVAVLLRHEQDVVADPALHIRLDFGNDGGGLARAGPADQKSKHCPRPFVFVVWSILPKKRTINNV